MMQHDFRPDRRALLKAAAGALCTAGLRQPAAAQGASDLRLRLAPATVRLGPERTAPTVTLQPDPAIPLRFTRGDTLQVTLTNALDRPAGLVWRGFGGLAAAEPLTAQPPVAPGSTATWTVPLRHAGTCLIDPGLLGDDLAPVSPLPLIVAENEADGADRDETLMIEEWRLDAAGQPLPPGADMAAASIVYTVNGAPDLDLTLKAQARLRLRLVNGCRRAAIGLRIEDLPVQVMAIDSRPAEPFTARDGRLVLPPGARTDVMVDAVRAPSAVSSILLYDGAGSRPIARLRTAEGEPQRATPLSPPRPLVDPAMPARLDLKNALRVELVLGDAAPWTPPAGFGLAAPPAFRTAPGRTVVVTLVNPAPAPVAVRLHGHHFRLLDQLDDGWKPFWLDTLLLDARQTRRIAFAADHAGRWLIEALALHWSAPRRLRWYAVG